MPPVWFEPTISAGERPQTYAFKPRGHWDRQSFTVHDDNIKKCLVQVLKYLNFEKNKSCNLIEGITTNCGINLLAPEFYI